MTGTCALCQRDAMRLTKHHLTPRTRHHNKRVRRETTRKERNQTVPFCRPCHNQVHALLTEKQLEREYYSVERLREHPEVQKWIAWVSIRRFGAVLR